MSKEEKPIIEIVLTTKSGYFCDTQWLTAVNKEHSICRSKCYEVDDVKKLEEAKELLIREIEILTEAEVRVVPSKRLNKDE